MKYELKCGTEAYRLFLLHNLDEVLDLGDLFTFRFPTVCDKSLQSAILQTDNSFSNMVFRPGSPISISAIAAVN